MKLFIALIALSVVYSVYCQSYGTSVYDNYDNSYDGIGLLTGSGRVRGSRRFLGGSLLGGARRFNRLGGRGRVYRPRGVRYIDTRSRYNPRRQFYPSSY